MAISREYYTQLIPEKIFQELDTICQRIEPKIKGFNIDCLCEIISIVACHTRKDKRTAHLKMTYIKKLVPQGDKYLKALIDLRIIERSGNAIKGKASYKYQFSQEYYSKYVSKPLQNEKLKRRIKTVWSQIKKEKAKTTWGKSEQIKFLKNLEIDSAWKEYTASITNIEQFNSVTASARRIENGDIFYSIDSTSQRFHSNVTNMKKDLRPFLRVQNEPLVNIDIKNSQPYLSTIILTNPGKASMLTNNRAFSILLQNLKVSHNEDVKKYIYLVVYGKLYEYLMQEFSKAGIRLTRTDTKIQVLRILFARNRTPKDERNKKCRSIFREHFPTVHKIFSKVRGSDRGDKFQNFKRFAILLQRIEAYLMLEVVLKRISRELPDTIAITIHDSIMTGVLTNNVKAVKNIISEELKNFVNYPPKIKIEDSIHRDKEMIKGRRKEREDKGNKETGVQYGATTFVSIN